ncbi:MAG: hypothetical protein M1835_007123 [Candelina submexicana]|nr:MAG: hypothetical protein M1835_007123 [Candelina submexicana]
MSSQHPPPFQNNIEHAKDSTRRPRYHLHRSYTAHPEISLPNRATTAPTADKHTHLHRHELRHRPHHKHKQVPQSAVQARPPGPPSGDVLGNTGSKSHGNTPAGSVWGSRPGSLVAVREGERGRKEKERETLRERDKAKKRNEELHSSLSALSSISTSTTRQLDELYYSILEKLTTLHTTISSLQDLTTLTTQLQNDFQTQSEELEFEVQGQIEGFASFDKQQVQIEDLEARVRKGREKVGTLTGRLERVRGRVEGWETREKEWQRRTSREFLLLISQFWKFPYGRPDQQLTMALERLRILWGVLASAFVLLLAIFIFHHLPVRHGGFPLARNMNTSQRLEEILEKHEDERKIPPMAKDVFREVSSRAEGVTERPSFAPASSQLPDNDPRLKVLDEL